MKLEEALEKLYSMHQFGIKLGLDNIRNLLAYLGNPEKKINAIHIAGSNGKGSTSSFIASILQEAGYKIGLFTSPHLVDFNERIRINGKMIPDAYITSFISEMDTYIRKNEPTFFELTTAMAFKYFAEEEIDYAVIETGLGGRLDATNVLDSIATVITSISREHTNIFGNDLRVIAGEKAGVIKHNRKVFIGIMPDEAEKVIIQKANNLKNEIFRIKDFMIENENYVSLKLNNDRLNNLTLNLYDSVLKGYFQFYNASLAILAVVNSFNNIPRKAILNGIKNVKINSGISSRYEYLSKKPAIIFDASHNLEGLKWFVQEFSKERKTYSKTTVLFGAMRDKEVGEMLKMLEPFFDEFRFVSIEYERALTCQELMQKGSFIKNKFIEENPAQFIKSFFEYGNNECLVVIGSIYLLGSIKEKLKKT